jgi:nucleoside-diphosphate-sugar epimerase
MATRMKHILCYGFGFSAAALAHRLDRSTWRVTGTSRSRQGVEAIRQQGFEGVLFENFVIPDTVTHVLVSAPPGEDGDPVLQRCAAELVARASQIEWLGYLSTTGVYGDHKGGWVDETAALAPATERGRKRCTAESQWLALHAAHGLPVHLFRLAGIYGPGRNQLESMRDGTARIIIKPGQIFSRIHVEDIAGILLASINRPRSGRAYNVADDEPCPPQVVVAYAAQLLGLPPPPEEAFDGATLSPMARSFYAESKRVSNARVKQELDYAFIYPTYREGLAALLKTFPHPPVAPG